MREELEQGRGQAEGGGSDGLSEGEAKKPFSIVHRRAAFKYGEISARSPDLAICQAMKRS